MISCKKILVLLLVLIPVVSVCAESDVESNTSVSLTISSLPEAKLTFTQSFTVPFLQGENFLVSGNNIKFSLSGELTPISMNLKNEIVLTPVAVMQIVAGGMIGSGWNANLFGGEVRGIGINRRDVLGLTSVDGSPFDSMFTEGHFGGALQFDLAAVIPGDWNHILLRTYHEAGYMSYGRAAPGDPWFYENDFGENQNGWNYYGNYLLGYQMPQKPIFLDTVALLSEMYKYLYDTPNGSKWQDALGRWEFSLVMNFAFTEKFSTALITQFRTLRRFNEYHYKKGEDNMFYQDRTMEDGNARELRFYRVAAIIRYSF